MTDAGWPRPITDLAVNIAFCTRLPLAHVGRLADGDIARASWAMPVAGALVGAAAALAYADRHPPRPAAVRRRRAGDCRGHGADGGHA